MDSCCHRPDGKERFAIRVKRAAFASHLSGSHHQRFDEWFEGLDREAKRTLAVEIELLKSFGPGLTRPHAGTLGGSRFANMKELRAKTPTAVLRVAFAFDTDRQAMLLIGGNKAGVNQKRFYKQLIDKADRLFTTHLARIRKKGKGE